jgi:CelD/BcsL family acetyltransferase involved in cellulose biosynthesis
MLSLDEVRDENALQALQAEWTTLLAQSQEATPFQSWEWVYPWWCHYRQGSLCVYTIREDGRLVALLPPGRDTALEAADSSARVYGCARVGL